MPLPSNVEFATLIGVWVNDDGTPSQGRVTIEAVPQYWRDPLATTPTTIVATKETIYLDDFGSIGSQQVIATDDLSLKPVDWVYEITVHLSHPRTKYSFYIEAPTGQTIDLTLVEPVAFTGGVAVGLVGEGYVRSIVHGSNAAAPRPSADAVVIWIGSVEPDNMIGDDLWIET